MQLSFKIWVRGQVICSCLILLLSIAYPSVFSLPICTVAIITSWFGGLPLLFLFSICLYAFSFFTGDKPAIMALSVSAVVLACFTALCCFSVCTGYDWQFWKALPELCVFGALAAIAGIASVLSFHGELYRHVRHFSF